MAKITRAQRLALKRVYDRCQLSDGNVIGSNLASWMNRNCDEMPSYQAKSYRQFRKTVQQGYDCIMIPWCGMWLGIEKDGYTHS